MQPFDLPDIARQALVTTLVVTAPVLIVALVVSGLHRRLLRQHEMLQTSDQ